MKLAHRKTSDFAPVHCSDIPIQATSLDIWDTKYRLKTKDGEPLDEDIDATYRRIALALAAVETTQADRDLWCEKFLHALKSAKGLGRFASIEYAGRHGHNTVAVDPELRAFGGNHS